MEVQPQLVLLQKTLLNIEGLGRDLYPDLDLWTTAKPFLEDWMKRQVGPKATLRHLKDRLPEWGEQLPQLPGLAHDVLTRARNGQLEVHWKSDQLQQLHHDMRRQHRATRRGIVGGALTVAAAIVYSAAPVAPVALAGVGVPIWILGVSGIGLMISAVAVR